MTEVPAYAKEFLERPGQPGAFGALMDEYARAAADFCRVAESIDPAAFAAERPSRDPCTRSPRTVCLHVWSAGRRYSDYIRKARGLPFDERFEPDAAALAGPKDVRARVAEALRYTEGALVGLPDTEEGTMKPLRFQVRWGPTYDPEMILEHAVVHLLRHRRQLERWERA